MKIVFLHLTMGVNDRGSEKVVDTLADTLSRKHTVTVIQGGLPTVKKYKIIRPFSVKHLPAVSPKSRWQKILFRLYLDSFSRLVSAFTASSLEHIKHLNPDIIIPINGAVQVKLIKRFFPGIPIVCFGHAGPGYHDRDVLKEEPDLFVAVSKPSAVWAKSLSSSTTKILYCPNPFDGEAFISARPATIDIPRPIVLSVGALSAYKNHELLIQSAALTKASLLILGKGEEKARLIELAAKLLPGRFQITSVRPDKMPSYYKSADVFCLLSDPQEAFGMVYLEAMAAGLPIAA